MIAPMLGLEILLISIYVANRRISTRISPRGVLRLFYHKFCITLFMFIDLYCLF